MVRCHNCKSTMKKMGQNNRWVQEHFYWCPECGTFAIEKHDIKLQPDIIWYKPGYLFEFNKEKK